MPQPGAAQAHGPWQSALSGATKLAMLLALLGGAGTAAVHLYRTLFDAGEADRGGGAQTNDAGDACDAERASEGAGGEAGDGAGYQLAAPRSAWRASPASAPWAVPDAADETASEDDVERLEAQLRCVRDELGRMSTAVHRQSSSLEAVASDMRAVAREVRTAVEATGDARPRDGGSGDATHEVLLSLVQQQQQELGACLLLWARLCPRHQPRSLLPSAELRHEVRDLRTRGDSAPVTHAKPPRESPVEVDGSPPPQPAAPHPTPAREGPVAAGEETQAPRHQGGVLEALPSAPGAGPSPSLARRRTEELRAAMHDLEAKVGAAGAL